MMINLSILPDFGHQDLCYSTGIARRSDISCSGGSIVTVKKEAYSVEDAILEEDLDLLGDASTLENTFNADLFNLPTPAIEDFKPSLLLENMSDKNLSGNNDAGNNNVFMASFQDLSGYVAPALTRRLGPLERVQQSMTTDSLSTPLVDPVMNSAPVFPSEASSPEYILPSPSVMDSFSIPTTVSSPVWMDTSASTVSESLVNQTTISNPLFTTDAIRFNIPNFSRVPIASPVAEATSSSASTVISSFTATASSNSSNITPSSSSSSITYAELKPRAQSTPDLMPTVIADHLYFNPRASTSRSATSPCLSVSSVASSSSAVDTKEFRSGSWDGLDSKSTSEVRRKNNEASKKSRLTKKQKLDEMCRREAELKEDNERKKRRVAELEAVTTHLRNYLFNVMKGVKQYNNN